MTSPFRQVMPLLIICVVFFLIETNAQSWNTQIIEPGEKARMVDLAKKDNGNYVVLLQRIWNRNRMEDPDTSNIEVLEYSPDGVFYSADRATRNTRSSTTFPNRFI